MLLTVPIYNSWRGTITVFQEIGLFKIKMPRKMSLSIALGSKVAQSKEHSILGGSCETHTDEVESRREERGKLDGDRT